MSADVLLQLAPQYAAQFAAAVGILLWVGRAWRNAPGSLLVRLAGHERRYLIALGCLIAPMILGWGFFRPLLMMLDVSVSQWLWLGVSVLAGLFVGMAVSCVVAPAQPEGRFHTKTGFIVLVLLILAPLCFVSLGGPFSPPLHLFLDVAVLFVATLLLRKRDDPTPSSPGAPQNSPTLAIILGFFPSALGLFLIAMANAFPHIGNDAARAILFTACLLSIVCCFAASILLFKRRTGLAIFGGVMLMLLNAFIALFTGCLALFTGASFR